MDSTQVSLAQEPGIPAAPSKMTDKQLQDWYDQLIAYALQQPTGSKQKHLAPTHRPTLPEIRVAYGKWYKAKHDPAGGNDGSLAHDLGHALGMRHS